MPLPDKKLSPDRVQFHDSLTNAEIRALASDEKIRVIQTGGPVDSRTWVALNERLFSKRPDVQLRVYGFYSDTCDLSFLWAMTNVERFAADCLMRASNVSAIAKLPKLRELSVGVFELEDLSFLADVSDEIEVLSIGQTRSKKPDLAVLQRFRNLRTISLEGQQKNIDVLSDLETLEDVTLRSITVKDLSFLRSLPRMWSLDIKLGGSNDLTALADIGTLKYLELWQIRGLSDLSAISRLPNLQYLFLQSLRQVTSVPDLSALGNIRRIFLDTMKGLHDVSTLRGAPNLEEFIHVRANNLAPRDYLPVLENPVVRRVLVGFGSDKKNDAFRDLMRKYGKDLYEHSPFEFRP